VYIRRNDALTSLEGLANITAAPWDLEINDNDSLVDFDGLNNINSIHDLEIQDNDALTNLAGLSALTDLVTLNVIDNIALPDCEACELLDQLTEEPWETSVYDNLEDSCTPVPDNCPGDPCPDYTGDDPCCLDTNPCDWDNNDICDCDSTCEWDAVDCEW
jgi:hypothetical protein